MFFIKQLRKNGRFKSEKITDLKRGDLVLSFDSFGNIDTTEVITIMDYGESFGTDYYI